MNGLTTVTTKGQVTIPEVIRRELGVKVGDKVYFSKVFKEKKQVIMRMIPKDSVRNLYGSLSSKGKYTPLKIARKKSIEMLARRYGLR